MDKLERNTIAAKYLLAVRERNQERCLQRWQRIFDWLANLVLCLAVIVLAVMLRG